MNILGRYIDKNAVIFTSAAIGIVFFIIFIQSVSSWF